MGCAPSHEAYPTTSDPNLKGGRAASGASAEVLAAISGTRQKAVAAAQELLDANKGKSHRDTYVRATLTSCGASCKVFSCANKYTQQQVAIKTIPKVSSKRRRLHVLSLAGSAYCIPRCQQICELGLQKTPYIWPSRRACKHRAVKDCRRFSAQQRGPLNKYQ